MADIDNIELESIPPESDRPTGTSERKVNSQAFSNISRIFDTGFFLSVG